MIARRAVVTVLAAALEDEPGWRRITADHFRHDEAEVDILIYAHDAVVTFGATGPSRLKTQTVGCKTVFFPQVAAAAVLEVARALVAFRTPAGQ